MFIDEFFDQQFNASKSIGPFKDEHRWLSNFAVSPIIISGIKYRTVEHFYQASKTIKLDESRSIITLPTPGEAKRAGRELTIREDWDLIKVSVMTIGTYSKYTQNEDFKLKLIETGNAKIIEFNTWHDNFWGQCTCQKCEKTAGENNLGKIIMQVRKDLVK